MGQREPGDTGVSKAVERESTYLKGHRKAKEAPKAVSAFHSETIW